MNKQGILNLIFTSIIFALIIMFWYFYANKPMEIIHEIDIDTILIYKDTLKQYYYKM